MKNVVFFSVYNGSRLDAANHIRVFKQLNRIGLSPKLVDGRYNGVNEKSLVLPISAMKLVEKLARQFKQESILIVYSDRSAALKFIEKDSIESIGNFTEVSQQVALSGNAFSLINQRYYVVL